MPAAAERRIVVAGGGAAGFFAAVAAAESGAHGAVTILEKSDQVLAKVRISGGGRCNVTHACFDPRELASRYPRGGRALIGPFTRFGPQETLAWFAAHGVALKTEADGRMFPVTDSSQTVIDGLTAAAERAGVRVLTRTGLEFVAKQADGRLALRLTNGSAIECERLLWAGGGCRTEGHPAMALGHSLVPPVPSLFTFQTGEAWMRELPGVSLESVDLSVVGTGLKASGPLLVTHSGVSGPAVLRLSAWGARELQAMGYRFVLRVNWLAGRNLESVRREIQQRHETSGGQTVWRSRWHPLPARLWEQLARMAGIAAETRWARLGRAEALKLATVLTATDVRVEGKSPNKEEFVTCGGIPLAEVDLKTMQSRLVPGLYFAGEALDIDGLTGGYNFQNAWTTGWLAGRAMAGADVAPPQEGR
jgi:hypothetical protein